MYQVMDAVLLRASAQPTTVDLPAWPDLDDVESREVGDWLRQVWSREPLAQSIEAASTELAEQVARVRAGQDTDHRRLRRTAMSVARYLLRACWRSTPFALFAGVAPAVIGAEPAVRWGRGHLPVSRPDGQWLDAVVTLLEGCLPLLRRLPVMVNDCADVREDRVVVPCQRAVGDGPGRGVSGPVDVSVRRSAAVAAVVDLARAPIVVAELVDKLCGELGGGSVAAESAVLRLVRARVLLTVLRPPMTALDGLAYVLDRLTAVDADAVPEAAETVRALRSVADQLRRHHPGVTAAAVPGVDADLAARMRQVWAGVGRPVVVDLRLDVAVTLPDTVTRHARTAAAALTRLSPYQRGMPPWEEYHAAFLERYGVGAVVPLAEVTDPATGLGLPATYRGSDRSVTALPVTDRERGLLRLAQQATMGGADEITLDEQTVADLAGPDDPLLRPPPHVELFVQVHAASVAALRRDRYTLVVSGAARAAGATTGRFLHLLDPAERNRFRAGYAALATVRRGAVPAQLSVPPLQASSDPLACVPRMLPTLLTVGEFTDGGGQMRVTDLAVGGDADGLFLVSLRHGALIEPTVFNAVEFRHFSHPMARLLCELPRARTAVYMPFSWGVADALPFLPRVRYGRTVLAPARWRLTAADLPPRHTPPRRWRDAFAGWRRRFRMPDRVCLVEADNVLPLDLTEPLHADLLRVHLDRHGQARLDEAPSADAYGWLDGHAHEITVALTSTAPATPAPALDRIRAVDRDDGHLPGDSPWLYAKLYTATGRTADVLQQVPDLFADTGAPLPWWFLPYRDPEHHVRLRVRLPHADAYGPAAAQVGAWAARLRRRRLLSRLQLDTYQPETGRYGHGPAMAAAEQVFVADSAAALAELDIASSSTLGVPELAAASLVDIAVGFTGDTAAAMRWLTTGLPNETAPTTRDVLTAAVGLADPSGDWAALRAADTTGTLWVAWQRRRAALADYRRHLAVQRDPLPVLASLSHLHSVRVHGIDPDRERLTRRLARAAALRWSALHPDPPQ